MKHLENHLPQWLRTPKNAVLFSLALLACAIYLLFAITPSSYALALHLLGQPVSGLIAGSPKPVRSDEWAVFTPYIQIAVKSHFATHDLISPYHEGLRAFLALPIADWGAVFKPYFLGFLLFPAANGFSFFYLFNTTAFLFGWVILFRLLRIDPTIATAVVLTLFFSQFVEVWWTSNCCVFALAPWPVVAWIYIEKRLLRVLVCAYATTAWVMADVYPPFLYGLGLAMLVAVIALRPGLLEWRRILDAVIAITIAALLLFRYFGPLISVMEATVYPGHRFSPGGGVESAKFLAQLFPFALTKEFQPLANLGATNACEVGVVGSLVPIFAIVFMEYRELKQVVCNHWVPILVLGLGALLTSAWIFLPIPSEIGRWVGLGFVPGNRLLVASGWLLTILFAYVMTNVRCRLSALRVAIFVVLMIAVIFVKRAWSGLPWQQSLSYFDFVPIIAGMFLLVVAIYSRKPGWWALLAAAVVINLVTFGFFNPIQSAYPIFSINSKAVRAHLEANGAVAVKGGLAIVGEYGAIVNGAGVASYNTVLLAPQLTFFRTLVSGMSTSQFNYVFNRYAHISFNNSETIKMPQPDTISLPLGLLLPSRDGSAGIPGKVAVNTHYCSLDVIVGPDGVPSSRMKIGAHGTFGGWFATTGKNPVKNFSIRLRGSKDYSIVATDSVVRPDVQKAIGGAGKDTYGFNTGTDFDGMAPGKYAIMFVAPSGEVCDPHRSLVLDH